MECRIRSTRNFLNENKLDQKTLINNIIFCKYLLVSLDSFKKSRLYWLFFKHIYVFFLDNIIRINIFYIFLNMLFTIINNCSEK